MRPTPTDVLRAAALARLELSSGEAERLAAQLGDILERVDGLEDGDAHAGPPAGSTAAASGAGLRADEPSADALAAGPESFAPGWADGFFTVPRLASHGGPGTGEEAT